MTFFQDYPVPEPLPRGRTIRFVPPPWAGAPAYELPAVVSVGQFLHRSPTRVMAIKSAQVYSSGCAFDLTWIVRRVDEDDEDWAAVSEAFFQHGSRRGAGQDRLDALLLFGVQLSDGSRASTAGHWRGALMDPARQPEAPVLTFQAAGGNGGDDEVSGSGTLWLWPLPPPGNVLLFARWKQLGFDENSIVLDGARLRAAATGAQKFWPEEQIR